MIFIVLDSKIEVFFYSIQSLAFYIYRYIYTNRKKPLVVYNLFILAKQSVSCYAHVSSYENTGFSRICEVLFADWRH